MKASTAASVRRIIAFIFKPITAPHEWWFGFKLWTGTVYAVCPDSTAVFFLLYAPLFVVAPLYFRFWPCVLAFAIVGPFVFWQVLRIRNGTVVRLRLLLGIPYWVTPVMQGSRFEQYQAWEDDRPTGVVFCLGATEVHFGSSSTAGAIYRAISAELEEQGWGNRNRQGPPPPERIEPTL